MRAIDSLGFCAQQLAAGTVAIGSPNPANGPLVFTDSEVLPFSVPQSGLRFLQLNCLWITNDYIIMHCAHEMEGGSEQC